MMCSSRRNRFSRLLELTSIALTLLAFSVTVSAMAQAPAPAPAVEKTTALPAYVQEMNRLAESYLDRRRSTLAAIKTKAQAEARQQRVRTTWLRLIGGLPDRREPLNARTVGSVEEDGFRIERVIYDSLPGYHVTANLYLPSSGKGPFPAVIYHAGHGPFGKTEAFGLASNLARNGIAVLAYDPLGAGERLQAMNPETGKSWAGPDEHSQAQISISLIGDHVSRYMMWDAMRGIDYLAGRSEIDANAIGSYGCSGGGTMSAYLTALDPRVKAGVVACYLTSYEELLKGQGPQDGEQVIPDQIANGLDFADLVELAAPRAYAMVSTTEDMFPFSGAKATHDEAEHFYTLFGAGDRLQFFTGPGGHGAIRPMMPQIIAFFEHWLAHRDDAPPEMVTLARPNPQDLQCTSTGQVSTALSGRSIYEINRERARSILSPKEKVSSPADLAALQSRLKEEVLSAAGMEPPDEALAGFMASHTEQRPGYRLETGTFQSRYGMELPAYLAIPAKVTAGPALLLTSEQPIDAVAKEGGMLDRAALAGQVVLAMTPLPWPTSGDAMRPTMGTLLPWTSRAFLVGKTLPGMRAEDMLSAVSWLRARSEVKDRAVDAFADGASGTALLHAAVVEPHIRRITLEHSLATFQSVVDVPVHRNVAESVIPGVLLHYDLDDLLIALGDRKVTLVDPVGGDGHSLTEAELREQLARVYRTNQTLGFRDRLTFSASAPGSSPAAGSPTASLR